MNFNGINQFRCQVCGDRLSAVHGQCFQCDSDRRWRIRQWQERLPILAANLAIGAALCRAFTIGGAVALDSAMRINLYQWRPGCRRPAP